MLVLHDDAEREYACGPAQGPSRHESGHLHRRIWYDEAKKDGWVVISMKKDWKRIFAFVRCPAKQSVTRTCLDVQDCH